MDPQAVANAPTIAQAKLEAPNLLDFLLAVPFTQTSQILYALLLGGALGMIAHYVRGRAAGNIAGSPADYFFRDNIWRSVGAMMAVVAELFGEAGLGLFVTEAGSFVGWGVVIMSGAKTGYIGDSLINKGQRQEWTEKKRDATEVVATAKDVKSDIKP